MTPVVAAPPAWAWAEQARPAKAQNLKLAATARNKQRAFDLEADQELRFQEAWRENRPALRAAPAGRAAEKLAALRDRVANRESHTNVGCGYEPLGGFF